MLFLRRFRIYIINPRVRYYYNCYTKRINHVPIGIDIFFGAISFIFTHRVIELDISNKTIQIFTINANDYLSHRVILYATFKNRWIVTRLEDMWRMAYFGNNTNFTYNY